MFVLVCDRICSFSKRYLEKIHSFSGILFLKIAKKFFDEEHIQLFMKYTGIFFPGMTLELGRSLDASLN